MRSYSLTQIIGILVLFLITACHRNDVEVELKDIQNDLVTFEVLNHTDMAIYSISFEIEYYQGDQLLLTDTVRYRMQDKTPYARARQTTMFAQRAPNGTDGANARVISYNE